VDSEQRFGRFNPYVGGGKGPGNVKGLPHRAGESTGEKKKERGQQPLKRGESPWKEREEKKWRSPDPAPPGKRGAIDGPTEKKARKVKVARGTGVTVIF